MGRCSVVSQEFSRSRRITRPGTSHIGCHLVCLLCLSFFGMFPSFTVCMFPVYSVSFLSSDLCPFLCRWAFMAFVMVVDFYFENDQDNAKESYGNETNYHINNEDKDNKIYHSEIESKYDDSIRGSILQLLELYS